MDDLGSRLLKRPERAPFDRMSHSVVALLERLAALHARYWQDARLSDPMLGLMSPRDALLFISPQNVDARLAMGDANPYLPLADQKAATSSLRLAPPTSAERLRAILADLEPIARAGNVAADARPRRCVGTESRLAAANHERAAA